MYRLVFREISIPDGKPNFINSLLFFSDLSISINQHALQRHIPQRKRTDLFR